MCVPTGVPQHVVWSVTSCFFACISLLFSFVFSWVFLQWDDQEERTAHKWIMVVIGEYEVLAQSKHIAPTALWLIYYCYYKQVSDSDVGRCLQLWLIFVYCLLMLTANYLLIPRIDKRQSVYYCSYCKRGVEEKVHSVFKEKQNRWVIVTTAHA